MPKEQAMIPGELLIGPGEHPLNTGRRTQRLLVRNPGDRPIQVGSHYHFAETNQALDFDRAAARGMRLNIASGTAVRFEPGQERTPAPAWCSAFRAGCRAHSEAPSKKIIPAHRQTALGIPAPEAGKKGWQKAVNRFFGAPPAWPPLDDAPTPKCSAPPWATACAWPTPG